MPYIRTEYRLLGFYDEGIFKNIGGFAEAYCGATPTECAPFLRIAVSSITSTASLPPTILPA
jgi:hypothetical protein